MIEADPRGQLKTIEFRVFGLPGPQGSKTFKGYKNGRGIMAESSLKVKPWRQAIQATADDNYLEEPIVGPVRVEIDFFFARPKSHYRTGKYAKLLKPDAPNYTISHGDGDLDKLLRSTIDGLSFSTGGRVIRDDCLVVSISSSKQYANLITPPGAAIKVIELP
jgi:crossover junction endodeoxyribonuclease RusA